MNIELTREERAALYCAKVERRWRRKEEQLDRLANTALNIAIGFLSAVVLVLALCL